MFDFLKKKIGGFIDKITKKEEEKEEPLEEEELPDKKIKEEKESEREIIEKKPKEPIKKETISKKETKTEKKPVKKERITVPKKEKQIEKPVIKQEKAELTPAKTEKEMLIKVEEKKDLETPVEKTKTPTTEIAKSEEKKEVKIVKKEIKLEEMSVEVEKKKGQTPAEQKKPEVEIQKIEKPKSAFDAIKSFVGIKEKPTEEVKKETKEEIKLEKESEKIEEIEKEIIETTEKKPLETPRTVQEKPTQKEKKEEGKKPKERIKLSAISTIKSIVSREVEIKESDVSEMLETLELELLEADVEISVAESIKQSITEKLIGSKIKKDQLHSFVTERIKETLIETITNDAAFDMIERLKETERPVKIIFLGINGAGKTTTIAKVAKLLMDNNYKVVFAAADTFRAAAIEQMEVHAQRLGIKTIKRDYGSDPTSVAYDAVNYAKARGIDAVLIDTAGRQDTNISLINEIKKMTRVIQPDIKIYIGESIAGNAIIEQISSFNNEIGIDAVILTKMDCDPKGGTMLSINKATGIPIIYIGTGQKYEDLELFEPEKIVERIIE